MLHRVAVFGNPQMAAGGIEHGTDHVHGVDASRPSADAGVVQVPEDVAEDVGGHHDVIRGQGLVGRLQEPADGLGAVFHGIRLAEDHPLFVGAADIIELDLIKAQFRADLGDGDVVIPDLLIEGVNPAQSLPVLKDPAALDLDGPFRPGRGQGSSLKVTMRAMR